MRKYFPIIISIMVFSGFLALQVASDIANISTAHSDKSRFNKIFEKQVFVDMKGSSISLKKVKSPVVIINFWASWCAPCLVELPSLVKISQKYGEEKVLVLGVNGDEARQLEKIKKMTAKYKINFPIVPDIKGTIMENFMVSKIPTTFIFHKGRVVRHIEGTEDFVSVEMMEFLEKLLKS